MGKKQQNTPEFDLVNYAVNLSFDHIDSAARQHVAHLIFDTVGIAIGAYAKGHKSGLITENHSRKVYSCAQGSKLWSGRGHVPADVAALCNGTWAEVLDYQDVVVDPRNNGHAGVTIVPAAFAVAERQGSSGAELITAISAGLEVTLAILKAVGREHRNQGRGFRTTSIASPIGAAIACSKLLGLNQQETLYAMGLAGACAPTGLMPSLAPSNGSFGMDKDWACGLGAQLGVNAADLAHCGMTSSDRVITGELGIVASFAGGDAKALEIPQGGTPNIGAFALKKFAACYGVHSAMEAAIDLMVQNEITRAHISKVIVRVKADSAVTLAGRNISNHMAARFSLPYAVASAVIRGTHSSAEDFEEPSIFDQEVLKFMEKIEIIADADLTEFHKKTGGFPAHVEIHNRGEIQQKEIHYPIGSLQRPMTWDDLSQKFIELTKSHLPETHLQHILQTAQQLLELKDIREFSKLL